jgi:hypothetical protein
MGILETSQRLLATTHRLVSLHSAYIEAGNYLAENVCAGTAEEALIQSFQELLDPRFRGGDTFS